MKKIVLSLLSLSVAMLGPTVKAQIRVNTSSQSICKPAGYNHVDYCYLSDIGVYYHVPNRQFIYLDAGRWVFSSKLPYHYRNYDLYHSHRVVEKPYPYRYWNGNRMNYDNYKNWHDPSQVMIRERRNYRQQSPRFVYKNHPSRTYKPQQKLVYNTQNTKTLHRKYGGYNRGKSDGKWK